MSNNKKLGQEQAFAASDSHEDEGIKQSGMSKRFYAACAAMQGLLSANPKYLNGNVDIPVSSELIELSYQYADELLKQEDE